jgi:hypothetical protein
MTINGTVQSFNSKRVDFNFMLDGGATYDTNVEVNRQIVGCEASRKLSG